MTDPSYPGTSDETGNDTRDGTDGGDGWVPEREPSGIPRWAKVLGLAVLVVAILVVVVVALLGGGDHGGGPGSH